MKSCRVFTCCVLLLVLLCLCPISALASSTTAATDPSAVTSSETETQISSVQPGEFKPAESLPYGVEPPDFYLEVENMTSLFVFTGRDGVVYKRYYGSIDGVFGYYAAEGVSNEVHKNSSPVDPEDDRRLLSPHTTSAAVSSGYIGLLPPEQGVTEVALIFGMPITEFLLVAGGVVVLLCVGIAVAGTRSRRNTRR